MFCPKCKSEYRDGFTKCADCCLALVHELQTEPDQRTEPDQQEYVDLRELLTTNDNGEIALFKSILEGEGIPFLAHGENFGRIQAYGMTVRFLVPKDYLKKAKELFENFI